ncbi:Phage capsid and scaffold [Thermodesulfovibrio sp. N1]|uniref:phage virion morphogenesis protein n=1 Tax=unclassified Thermodesulfovibrio TaxID=2645936 RepID=UPI00083AF165|nr:MULTISPECIES: phage virion morphogenesis protein [unclassified Thermodesulfovibrio]MDI1471912.1 phage virion morphogenesis protein [Thermodesulfovibrio sp. 1176]ODA43624.1 Phage capsid and scaffold [Thermodesulfovibrio sp. N1]
MIKIEIDDRQFREAIQKLIQRGIDRRPLMRNIAMIMHNAVEENFAQQGRPSWRPLSPKTIKARQQKGYWPGSILQMRGRLASSITAQSDNDKAMVGTNVVYAAIHQFGGRAGRGHRAEIPARPFLSLTEEDLNDIKETVIDYLKGV